jgi:hypothetical protein
MKPSLQTAALLFAALVLQSCVSKQPSAAIVAASRPSAATPSMISGPLLGECLRDARGNSYADNQNLVASYDPAVTLGFASKMEAGHQRVAPYASRVRVYVAKIFYKGIWGQGYNDLDCIYDITNGNLRYLTFLVPERDGRVDRNSISGAVLKSYALMTGKNVTKVQLFGVYAD